MSDRSNTPRDSALQQYAQSSITDSGDFAFGYQHLEGMLRELKRKSKRSRVMTIHDGVIEETSRGVYAAALQTDSGPLYIESGAADPQLVSSSRIGGTLDGVDASDATAAHIIERLSIAQQEEKTNLVCVAELTDFSNEQRTELLPLLWDYILKHRDSKSRDEIVAVGAAIRKYAAIVPMEQMGTLAELIEVGYRATPSIEIEIEVAKMVVRNFEIHPPRMPDPFPQLASRLRDIANLYMEPRILPRDKHSAAASLSVVAIVAMRSSQSEATVSKALMSSHKWFARIVRNDIDRLSSNWLHREPALAKWLQTMVRNIQPTVSQ